MIVLSFWILVNSLRCTTHFSVQTPSMTSLSNRKIFFCCCCCSSFCSLIFQQLHVKTVKLSLAEVQGSTKWLPKTNRPLNLVLDLYKQIICRNSENNRTAASRSIAVTQLLFSWHFLDEMQPISIETITAIRFGINIVFVYCLLIQLKPLELKHSSFSGARPNPFHAWFQTPRAQRGWVQKDSLYYKTRWVFFPPIFHI